MYECAICQNINSASRLRCSCCGTIPAMYSVTHKTVTVHSTDSSKWMTEIVAAHGCERAEKRVNVHVKLRTMPLDYYSEQ